MTLLITTPDRDSHGGHDFTWAFKPDSEALHRLYPDSIIVRIDLSLDKPARQRQLLAAIERHQPDRWANLGHGLPGSIPQLGIDTDAEIAHLAGAIAAGSSAPRIALYSCLNAAGPGQGGDGGLADRVRDGCVKQGASGVRVFSHTTAGDTTRNAHVRVFDGPEAKPGNVGGRWLVDPTDAELYPVWRCCDDHRRRQCPRKGVHGVLRLEFPWLEQYELEARLREAT